MAESCPASHSRLIHRVLSVFLGAPIPCQQVELLPSQLGSILSGDPYQIMICLLFPLCAFIPPLVIGVYVGLQMTGRDCSPAWDLVCRYCRRLYGVKAITEEGEWSRQKCSGMRDVEPSCKPSSGLVPDAFGGGQPAGGVDKTAGFSLPIPTPGDIAKYLRRRIFGGGDSTPYVCNQRRMSMPPLPSSPPVARNKQRLHAAPKKVRVPVNPFQLPNQRGGERLTVVAPSEEPCPGCVHDDDEARKCGVVPVTKYHTKGMFANPHLRTHVGVIRHVRRQGLNDLVKLREMNTID